VAVEDVTLALGDGQRAAELLDAICTLYDAVFSQPPCAQLRASRSTTATQCALFLRAIEGDP